MNILLRLMRTVVNGATLDGAVTTLATAAATAIRRGIAFAPR